MVFVICENFTDQTKFKPHKINEYAHQVWTYCEEEINHIPVFLRRFNKHSEHVNWAKVAPMDDIKYVLLGTSQTNKCVKFHKYAKSHERLCQIFPMFLNFLKPFV